MRLLPLLCRTLGCVIRRGIGRDGRRAAGADGAGGSREGGGGVVVLATLG